MHLYPHRAFLQGFESEIFKLVFYAATPEQWAEWLRVPLEHAAAHGNLKLLNALLKAGVNGGAGWRGCRGRTLIDAAALGGNVGVMSALLRAGAQPDVNVVSASSGRSALYTAVFFGHEAVARRLIFAGANVDFWEPVHRLSVLHESVWGGHGQLTSDLTNVGAYLETRDKDDGRSPLHFAACSGFDGIVSTLLLRGANVNAQDMQGYTPLMEASEDGHLAVVDTLLAAGANFNIRTYETVSALDLAAQSGHVDVIQAILGFGADVNAHDSDGLSAVHGAAMFDQIGAIDVLIEAGADIEFKTVRGATALAFAASHCNSKALLALLRRGATTTTRDNHGYTPLHLASRQQNIGMEATVDILLRWGADETALSNGGQTPADLLLDDGEGDNLVTQGELERTKLLMSRAPADRAWRRRGWLVMLRSRADKARTSTTPDGGDNVRDDPSATGGPSETEGCKLARRGLLGRGVDHTVRGQASRGAGTGGTDGDCDILSIVGALLIGLEPEGVFRTVVRFL